MFSIFNAIMCRCKFCACFVAALFGEHLAWWSLCLIVACVYLAVAWRARCLANTLRTRNTKHAGKECSESARKRQRAQTYKRCGGMAEWLNAAASKSVNPPLSGFGGSNPPSSARNFLHTLGARSRQLGCSPWLKASKNRRCNIQMQSHRHNAQRQSCKNKNRKPNGACSSLLGCSPI